VDDLPACGTVPLSTTLPRAPGYVKRIQKPSLKVDAKWEPLTEIVGRCRERSTRTLREKMKTKRQITVKNRAPVVKKVKE
jgi:hypothetical protein